MSLPPSSRAAEFLAVSTSSFWSPRSSSTSREPVTSSSLRAAAAPAEASSSPLIPDAAAPALACAIPSACEVPSTAASAAVTSRRLATEAFSARGHHDVVDDVVQESPPACAVAADAAAPGFPESSAAATGIPVPSSAAGTERPSDSCCCTCCVCHNNNRFCCPSSRCSNVVGAARVAVGCSTRRRKQRYRSSDNFAGMPVWEYVFLRRVGIRDRVQSTWFRPVFTAYASAQAESKRLLAANFSAVALAAASTAAASAATDIAATATAKERNDFSSLLSGSDGVAASSAAAPAAAAVGGGRLAAGAMAGAAGNQTAGTVVGREGQTRQAIFPPLFSTGGDAAATASHSSTKAASATSSKQDTARKGVSSNTAGRASAAGTSSTFHTPSIARHFRRAAVLRGTGSSSSIGSSNMGETRSGGKIETSCSSSGNAVVSSSLFSRETTRDSSTLVGSREALQLQFFLQQEVQQQLQQQQVQQLKLLAASSFSALCNMLLDHNSKNNMSNNHNQEGSIPSDSTLPFFSMLKGGGGGVAAGGEIAGDFAAAAASVLQQQRENTLAVQLLQQKVELLQKQLEEKTSESGVLRRLVTEREEDLKEKEKEIAESKKACFLLQSERKHLNKALHAAQQEGMEKALENERYLRELLRHKEAEAVRLNEVQQLYVSLMHQQHQQQQLVCPPPSSHDTDNEEEDDNTTTLQQQGQQQGRESPREPLHQQGHPVCLKEKEKRSAYGGISTVESGVTALRKGNNSKSNFRCEEQQQEPLAAFPAADDAAAAVVAVSREHVDDIYMTNGIDGRPPQNRATAEEEEAAAATVSRSGHLSITAPEQQQHQQHKVVTTTTTTTTTAVNQGIGSAGLDHTGSADVPATGPKNNAPPLPLSNDIAADVYVHQKQEETVGGNMNADGFVTPSETAVEEASPIETFADTIRATERDTFVAGPSSLLKGSLHSAATAVSIGTGHNPQVRRETEGNQLNLSATISPVDRGSCTGAAASAAVLPCAAAGCTTAAPAQRRKTSIGDASRPSSQQSTSAGRASAVPPGVTETVSRSSSTSSSSSRRPSVVNPLLQLLSLSPSWARGAGKTVLRGSPRPKPIVMTALRSNSNNSSSSSNTLLEGAAIAQNTSATARASAATAARKTSAGREGTRVVAAIEKTVEEEDAEWGVVAYTSHSRHSSGERNQQQPSTHPQRRDIVSRRKSSTSAAVESTLVAKSAVTGGVSAASADATSAGKSGDAPPPQAARTTTAAAGSAAAAAATASERMAPVATPLSSALPRGVVPSALSAALVGKTSHTHENRVVADGGGATGRRVEECICPAEETSILPSLSLAACVTSKENISGASADYIISAGAPDVVEGTVRSSSNSSRNNSGRDNNSSSTSSSSSGSTSSSNISGSSSSDSSRNSSNGTSSSNVCVAANSSGMRAADGRKTELAAISSSCAVPTKDHTEGASGRGSVCISDRMSSSVSSPIEVSALLRSAAAAIASHPVSAAIIPPAQEMAASSPSAAAAAAAGAAATAAAAVMAAFARPAAEAPLAGCFREGICEKNKSRGGEGGGGEKAGTYRRNTAEMNAASEKEEGSISFLSQNRGYTIQPPVKVRQRLLAHRGPVHACCAVPPLWSSQLLSACSAGKSCAPSSSVSSLYTAPSRRSGYPGEEDEEEMTEKAHIGESTSTTPGLSHDFVLTCGQDGFLALIDATRGYLAYSFLVSPFKSALLCVDAAADRPLAVVAAADVSLYTVDTVNQRVIASLKGHNGRITACGFLRSGENTMDGSVCSSRCRSTLGAAASSSDSHHSIKKQRDEEYSSRIETSDQHLQSSPLARKPSLSSSSVTSESRGGSRGVHTPAAEDISRVTMPSSTSVAAAATGGGSSRRVVPRALELLVTRALKGAAGGGSATLWSSGLDRTVRFWDVERSACVRTTKLPSAVTSAAASPCGEWLAATHQNGAVSLVNARTERGEKIATLQLHDGEPAVGVAFHPSGRWLVSVGQDKQVKVVDVRNWREVYGLLHIEMRYNVVQAAPTFSPDGNYVVAVAGPHLFCWSLSEDRLHARSKLLQQRETGESSAGARSSSPYAGTGGVGRNKQQEERKTYYYQGSAAKRQQILQFSRDWTHRAVAEALQDVRTNSNYTNEGLATSEDWQPPVCMQSQTSEIVCLDWQLPHLVTGNRDGSICFWE